MRGGEYAETWRPAGSSIDQCRYFVARSRRCAGVSTDAIIGATKAVRSAERFVRRCRISRRAPLPEVLRNVSRRGGNRRRDNFVRCPSRLRPRRSKVFESPCAAMREVPSCSPLRCIDALHHSELHGRAGDRHRACSAKAGERGRQCAGSACGCAGSTAFAPPADRERQTRGATADELQAVNNAMGSEQAELAHGFLLCGAHGRWPCSTTIRRQPDVKLCCHLAVRQTAAEVPAPVDTT